MFKEKTLNISRRVVDSEVICCVFEVLEKGSGGEDLAVFCRSVISYCTKRGAEVCIIPACQLIWESASSHSPPCSDTDLGSASSLLLSRPSILALT